MISKIEYKSHKLLKIIRLKESRNTFLLQLKKKKKKKKLKSENKKSNKNFKLNFKKILKIAKNSKILSKKNLEKFSSTIKKIQSLNKLYIIEELNGSKNKN